MAWSFTHDVDVYTKAALPLLSRSPIEHTIALTVVEYAGQRSEPCDPPELYGWWTDQDGAVTGAMLHTPGYEPLLERAPDDAIRPLFDALTERDQEISGVNGPTKEAVTFGAVVAATGRRVELKHAMRLFQLAELRQPSPLPCGQARVAVADDEAMLIDWVHQFALDTHTPVSDAVDSVQRRLGHGGFWLWVDADDVPVSMAARNIASFGVSRIGPVYTPAEWRCNGFGAGVTAALAATILDTGDTPVLFTDLANPTSNALYQRLGFRPVTDRVWLTFPD